MTVKELIEYLEKCNPEYKVVVGYEEDALVGVLERTNHVDSDRNDVYLY